MSEKIVEILENLGKIWKVGEKSINKIGRNREICRKS
jgi:hypothetical protein